MLVTEVKFLRQSYKPFSVFTSPLLRIVFINQTAYAAAAWLGASFSRRQCNTQHVPLQTRHITCPSQSFKPFSVFTSPLLRMVFINQTAYAAATWLGASFSRRQCNTQHVPLQTRHITCPSQSYKPFSVFTSPLLRIVFINQTAYAAATWLGASFSRRQCNTQHVPLQTRHITSPVRVTNRLVCLQVRYSASYLSTRQLMQQLTMLVTKLQTRHITCPSQSYKPFSVFTSPLLRIVFINHTAYAAATWLGASFSRRQCNTQHVPLQTRHITCPSQSYKPFSVFTSPLLRMVFINQTAYAAATWLGASFSRRQCNTQHLLRSNSCGSYRQDTSPAPVRVTNRLVCLQVRYSASYLSTRQLMQQPRG
ncbi:hypothetical protein J6590_060914 [Homalodisca vitripennis]|nr:hypothetical protein J6590_060914 [Homalodisca vitripennis]